MNKKKVLITGIAGMIGANFAIYLIKKGYEVIGIDDLSGGYQENIPFGVKQFYRANCSDSIIYNIISTHRPDYVYHFAAYAAEGLSPYIRKYNYENNVVASANVISACIENDVKKIIFTSSMAVYGHTEPPFKEIDPPNPADPYGIAKYTIELDLALAKEQFGLDYSIVRPHNVIGIYQNIWDRYRNVIGIWIRQILNNEPLTIYGDGTQTRAFSDVDYIMSPLEKLMASTSEINNHHVFNIGADFECEINYAATTLLKIAEQNGYTGSIKHLEARNEVKHAFCDHSLAKDILGFEDKTQLDLLIQKMFIWAKDQPNREIKKMNYEITKNMYSFWR